MTTPAKPALPELPPATRIINSDGRYLAYTADQMYAYARAAIDAARSKP